MKPPTTNQNTVVVDDTPKANLETDPKNVNSTVDQSFSDATAVLDAEIRWCHKIIESHSSYRSCLWLNPLFQNMFSEKSLKDFWAF